MGKPTHPVAVTSPEQALQAVRLGSRVPVTARALGSSLAELPAEALVSVGDVARFVGCSPRTVQRAGIPCVIVTPRVRRYRVRDIRAWVNAHVRGGD
jgi:hypothetical protein